MSSVDKRIVEMEFRNGNFEQGANRSMSTLDKLTEKLKFKNGISGLTDLGAKSKGVNFDGAIRGVSMFETKLSAMSVVGITALTNITNSAINTGKKMASALTIDPITTGFQEYETKMGSIQTILTNTAHAGTSLKQVTGALNELNLYADKTIYNFSEMTRNIGTFTAAGVSLDDSVMAIKGIANLAAGSGSTAQQASTAMYQLSQAIASGKVNLQDWNSVVNAGMGGKLFQDALKKTGLEMGAVIDKTQSFRESISDVSGTGWLTSEILLKTLQDFANDESLTEAATKVKTFTGLWDTMKESVQSGWAVSWEYIIGDFETAPEFLTNISNAFADIVGPAADARNEMLQFWNEAGGRDDVIAGLTNIAQSIGKVLKAASDGFREMVPAMTGEKLVDITKTFRLLTEKFKASEPVLNGVKNVFKAIGSVVQLVGKVFRLFGTIISPITSRFDDMIGVVAKLVGGFADLIVKVVDSVNSMKLFEGIGKFIKQLYKNVGEVGKFIVDMFKTITSGVGDLNLMDIFKPMIGVFGKVADGLSDILSNIGTLIGTMDMNSFIKLVNTALMGKGITNLKGLIKEIGTTTKSVNTFGENISQMIDGVTDTLAAMQTKLKADALMKIAGAISMLSLALVVLSSIDSAGMDNAIVGMMTLALTLTGSLMGLLTVASGKNLGALFFLSGGIKAIAVSMILLSSAMKIVSTMSWEDITKGLLSVVALTTALTVSMKLLSGSKASIGLPLALMGVATSIVMLTQAVKQLADIDGQGLGNALVAVGALMLELSAFMLVMKGVKMNPSAVMGLFVISGALNLMTVAVRELSKINPNELIVGLAGLGGILLELAIFTRLVGTGKGLISTATGLTIISGAMLVFGESIKRMGSLKPEVLSQGLFGLAGALVAVGLGVTLIPKGIAGKAVGLTIMGVALLNISTVLERMGDNSWDEIARGLVAIGGSLVVLAGGLRLMGGTMVGSAALIVASGGLALLTTQFKTLANLDMRQITMGLLAMAGSFGVLGLAGLALAPLAPAILALSGSLLAMSASAVLFAGSLTLTSAGLMLFGGAMLILIEGMRQFADVLPKFTQSMGNAFTELGPSIATAVTSVANSAGEIALGIITALKDILLYIPDIIAVGVDLVIALVEGIGSQMGRMAEAGAKILIALGEGLTTYIQPIAQAGLDFMVAFINYIATNLGMVVAAGIELALSFIEGVANGIDSNHERAGAAVESLITSIINLGLSLLGGAVSGFVTSGGNLITGLTDGISKYGGMARDAVKGVIDKAKSAASNLGSALVSAGKDLIRGFSDGIKNMASNVIESVTGVVKGAVNKAKSLLGIHSPSRVFMEIGDFTVQGFSKGIKNNSKKATRAMGNMTNSVIDTFRSSMDGLDYDIDANMNPVITPMIDLSEVKNGGKNIDTLLGGLTSIGGGLSASLSGSIKMGRDSSNFEVLHAIKSLNEAVNRPNNINNYNLAGITYDDGSSMSNTIGDLVRMAKIERRK